MTQSIAIGSATLTAVVLLALVACGESSDSPNQPAASATHSDSNAAPVSADAGQTNDPCTLLTDEEIKQITGYAVLTKKTVPGGGGRFAPGCDWELKTDNAIPVLHRISINVASSGGRDKFNFLASSIPRVSGLGDGAVKNGGNTDGTVWAVVGDTLVTLRYALPVNTVDPDPLVFPLLKLVLSRQ